MVEPPVQPTVPFIKIAVLLDALPVAAAHLEADEFHPPLIQLQEVGLGHVVTGGHDPAQTRRCGDFWRVGAGKCGFRYRCAVAVCAIIETDVAPGPDIGELLTVPASVPSRLVCDAESIEFFPTATAEREVLGSANAVSSDSGRFQRFHPAVLEQHAPHAGVGLWWRHFHRQAAFPD